MMQIETSKQCANQCLETWSLTQVWMKFSETETILEITWKTILKISSKDGVFGLKQFKSLRLPSHQKDSLKTSKLNSDKRLNLKLKLLSLAANKKLTQLDKNQNSKFHKLTNLMRLRSSSPETTKD